MASMARAAIETLQDPSFGPELVPAEAQPAPEMYGTGTERGSDCLDRIATGIYERAVRLHQRDYQQWVRPAAALQFRAKLADLKEQIEADVRSLLRIKRRRTMRNAHGAKANVPKNPAGRSEFASRYVEPTGRDLPAFEIERCVYAEKL